ncbi:hypothetical protein ACS0TY_021052 [Phlomoides rotata]
MGTFKLMPSTLALRAVQRHAATSRSASPSRTAQHLSPDGGSPITTFTNPSRSAQTPSFNVSRGQKGFTGGALGLGWGWHGSQVWHGSQAVVNVEEMREARMKAAVVVAIGGLGLERRGEERRGGVV